MAAAVNHAASRTNAPRHIIMFNIPFGRAAKNKDGARTFSNITLPRLERYAGLVGATLRVIRNRTEVSITPEVRSAWTRSPAGRGNSTIYVLKLLAVGQALQQLARNGGGAQARVLLIDDSVFITPNASDVFRVCHPEAAVCGFSEGTSPVPEPGCRAKVSARSRRSTSTRARSCSGKARVSFSLRAGSPKGCATLAPATPARITSALGFPRRASGREPMLSLARSTTSRARGSRSNKTA
jgi:hypothetical protein